MILNLMARMFAPHHLCRLLHQVQECQLQWLVDKGHLAKSPVALDNHCNDQALIKRCSTWWSLGWVVHSSGSSLSSKNFFRSPGLFSTWALLSYVSIALIQWRVLYEIIGHLCYVLLYFRAGETRNALGKVLKFVPCLVYWAKYGDLFRSIAYYYGKTYPLFVSTAGALVVITV